LTGIIRSAISRIEEGFGDAMNIFSGKMDRSIGLIGVIIISLSAMLGSGLFVLPSLAAGMIGPGIWLAYLLAAIVVLPGALSKSELATAMPTSGGDYTYIEKTFGPVIGSIAGLGLWASFLLKAAFALIGFGAYLIIITNALGIEAIDIKYSAILLLVFIVGINILGVSKVKAIQAPIVVSIIVILLLICIMAIFNGQVEWNKPVGDEAWKADTWGVIETAALVFVAYAGVTKVAAIGEEVKNPARNLPRGMLYSLGIATLLYVGVTFMIMATVSPDDIKGREDPIYVFAEYVGGSWIGIAAAVLAVLTMASMALAGILAASRFPFGMARDNLLPEVLENVHPRFETPHWTIIITGLVMGISILILPISDIAKLASGFQIMIFIAVHACVLVLRKTEKKHKWYKPEFRCPWTPFTQIFGISSGLLLIIMMGSKAFIGAGAAITLGLLLWATYGRHHHTSRETPWNSVLIQMRNPTENEHQRRDAVFHACDLGGKNHLNVKEFIKAMETLGFELNHDEIRNVFHVADVNADGVIDIDEFLSVVEGEIGLSSSE
jgi:amino acid transporter